MKFPGNKNIHTKVKLVILSTSLLTIFLVYAGFFIYELITYREILVKDISTKAVILAQNSNVSLVFRDSTDAAQLLNSLASQSNIMSAAIYDSNKRLFASYTRGNEKNIFPPKPVSSDYWKFEKEALVVYKPINLNDEQIGTIYLSMDLQGQKERFWSFIKIAFLVLIGTLTAAYIVSSILAKNISAPIMNLAGTSLKVSQQQDYTIRASKAADDETGFLADSFNRMLSQIQERDANLRLSNDTLQSAEKRFRTTLDNLLDGCQIIGFDYKYLYVNDAAATQGRRKKEELLGKTITEMYPGIETSDFFTELQRCLNERTSHRMKNEFKYPDGSSGWFELDIQPVPEGAFILSSDITKEKELNDEVEKYREHLEELVNKRTLQVAAEQLKVEGLLNFTPDAIIAVNHEGNIVLVNHQAETLFGYGREELLGSTIELLLPQRFREVHVGHRQSYFSSPKIREMGAGLELFARRKDGTEFPVEVSLSPFETEEGIVAISAIRDITERKLAEREIRKQKQDVQDFINSMSTLCAKIATDGKILIINRIAQQSTGLLLEDLVKVNFLNLQWWSFDPEVQSRVRDKFNKACSGVSINYDEKIFAFDQKLTINFSLTPIFETANRVVYVVAEGRDITPLKLAEAALQERSEQLESANKELEAFSYSVSHDMRAPLRAISGYTRMLEEDYSKKLDSEGNRLLGVIQNNAHRMGSLIDDLLALSRLGRKEIQKTFVDMKKLTQDILLDFNKSVTDGYQIKIGDLHPVMADYSLMNNVITNLLSNAIKYSSKKENPYIEIKSEKKENEIIYSISDNGVGFDMQYVQKLFGVFQRLHTLEEFEGTGVGLAIVQRIIKKHGGSVWAEGKLNEGAEFYFSLPDVEMPPV